MIRKAVLNTVAAAGANVKDDVAVGPYPGSCIICADNTANPLLNILPPIFKGTCVAGWKQASAVEVRQIVIGGGLVETIVASTRYKITIWNGDTYEGQKQENYNYAYTTPAVLSGVAATDRLTVFTQLVNKINAHTTNKVTAYLAYKVAFTTGSTALPVVGETVTQQTSNVTAKIARVDVTSGNYTATSAAGTIWLYDFSALASWNSGSKTITGGTSTSVMTTNAVLTSGAGIVILDDANYYYARPNSKRGPSYVELTDGWTVATLESIYDKTAGTIAAGTAGPYLLVGRAPVISQGIGSRLSLDSPVFAADKVSLVTGEAGMITNEAFNVAKTYTTYIMSVNNNPSDTNITGYTKGAPVYYVLYADESGQGTELADFETALEAALSVTFV
ncbi:MAG: hypothetical protein WC222_11305 [Parachlamydiales bacterium]